MIIIHYSYVRKFDGTYQKADATFYDVYKAVKFIYSLRKNKSAHVHGWTCEYSEDNEYLASRINLF